MMRSRLFSFLAFLLLLSFGWTQAEPVVHGWLHHDDAHCTATEKHFHEKEHHCFACDLTVHAWLDHQPQDFSLIVSPVFIQASVPCQETILPAWEMKPRLRGPPAFSALT